VIGRFAVSGFRTLMLPLALAPGVLSAPLVSGSAAAQPDTVPPRSSSGPVASSQRPPPNANSPASTPKRPAAVPSGPAPTASAPAPAPAPARGVMPPGHPSVAHPAVPGHGGLDAPHAGTLQLLKGSPFSSAMHGRQAELARAGQRFQPEPIVQQSKALAGGSIGVLLKDGQGSALPGVEVKLIGTRESIAEGDRTFVHKSTSDAEGRAGFVKQPTDSHFKYEAVVDKDGARYSSGPFRLKPDAGTLVELYVFPTTHNADATFLATRALYGIEARADVFQLQTLFRIYNTNPITWIAKDFRIPLPPDAKAFRPMQHSGDIRLQAEDGAVLLSGTFTPGQHEFSFGYQLENPGNETMTFGFPTLPTIVDARVVLEASSNMNLSVRGFRSAVSTHGSTAELALMAEQDFLRPLKPPPEHLVATVTGLPTRGHGPSIAAAIAALLALLGLAISRDRSRQISEGDRNTAKTLLLDELVAVERAHETKQIGPKTYERTRRLLLDAIARLDQSSAA
jgi:hypothetical protein